MNDGPQNAAAAGDTPDDRPTSDAGMSEARRHGLAMMSEAYGFEMSDGPGDFFAETADHLFGRIWARPGLSHRDRRLLLLGALTARGDTDVADIQVGAALGNGELSPDELDEIVLFLCYYVGWPGGTKLGNVVGPHVARARRAERRSGSGAEPDDAARDRGR